MLYLGGGRDAGAGGGRLGVPVRAGGRRRSAGRLPLLDCRVPTAYCLLPCDYTTRATAQDNTAPTLCDTMRQAVEHCDSLPIVHVNTGVTVYSTHEAFGGYIGESDIGAHNVRYLHSPDIRLRIPYTVVPDSVGTLRR